MQAYELARERRPVDVSEDGLNEGAAKWWKRLDRGVLPTYLLEGPEISTEVLAGWMIRSGRERQRRAERMTRAWAETSLEAALDTATAADGLWIDRNSAPLDESVAERLESREHLSTLGAIDPVLSYRALGYSYEEIARALGIRTGTARVRMMRGSKRVIERARVLADGGGRSMSLIEAASG